MCLGVLKLNHYLEKKKKQRRDVKINEILEDNIKEIIEEIEILFCREVDLFKETDQMENRFL